MSKVEKTIRHKVTSSKKLHLKKNIVLRQQLPFVADFSANPEFFQQVFNNAPFHLGATNKEGYFILWNKISEKMFGYTKDEVIGKLKPEILHRNKKEAQEVSMKALEIGNFHGEVILKRRSGECFSGLLDINVNKDKNGNVCCIVGSAMDLSKEKKIEAEHEISESKYRNLFENSKDAILQLDKMGNILNINQVCKEISGYSSDFLIGKNVTQLPFFSIKTQLVVASRLKEIFIKGSILDLELDLQHKNGQGKVIEINANLVKRSGEFQYIQIMARDVTRRKSVEDEHILIENRYTQIFNNSKDAILFADCKGKILDANKACKKISGYEINDLIDKYIFKLSFLNFKKRHLSLISIFLNKKNVDLFDIGLIHKNGQKKVVEVSVSPADSKTFQLIIRDITARKQAEDALRESENTHRTIVENTGAATVIVEEDMTLSFANDQFVKMSGYSKEQIISKMKWPTFFVKKDVDQMKKFHTTRRISPKSVPRNYEARFVDKKGNIKNLYLTVVMIPGTKKSVASFLDITPMKIVENELRSSKKLFDDLAEGTPIGMFVINTDHKIVYWNKALEKLTGCRASKMIGTSDHWKPFYKKKTDMMIDMIIDKANLKDVFKLERYKNMDVEEGNEKDGIICSDYFESPSGEKRWVRFLTKPLYDMQNNLIGAIEIIEDLTEIKNIRNSLENRMREFQVLYKVNAHMRMLDPLDVVLKKITEDLVLACDQIKPARSRIVFGGKVYTNLKKGENFIRSKKAHIVILGQNRGEIELGYIKSIPDKESFMLKHEQGVLGIIASTISRHIQHREIVKRYKRLITESIVGIFILQDGLFQYVNPKFTKIFKVKAKEVIGMPCTDIISNCSWYKKGKNVHCTIKAERSDGVPIDVEFFTQTISYYGRDAVLGTIQDVTKLKKARERQRNFNSELKLTIAEKTKDLREANRRLQSLNELKDEFIAVTSHELRSPLTAARGYLSFLTDENMFQDIPIEARSHLARVYDNVELLNNLVNNILNVSRIEMGRFELQLKSIDIIDLIKQSIRSLSFQANEKNITINFVNELGSQFFNIQLDQVRILQVIRNILDNAIKYSYEGSVISVKIGIRGIGLEIAIADEGMGICKSEIFEIFDKFKQAKNAHSQYKGGAGLGLFIAKKIVELHNGMIWVESKLNEGAVFRIQLPL